MATCTVTCEVARPQVACQLPRGRWRQGADNAHLYSLTSSSAQERHSSHSFGKAVWSTSMAWHLTALLLQSRALTRQCPCGVSSLLRRLRLRSLPFLLRGISLETLSHLSYWIFNLQPSQRSAFISGFRRRCSSSYRLLLRRRLFLLLLPDEASCAARLLLISTPSGISTRSRTGGRSASAANRDRSPEHRTSSSVKGSSPFGNFAKTSLSSFKQACREPP